MIDHAKRRELAVSLQKMPEKDGGNVTRQARIKFMRSHETSGLTLLLLLRKSLPSVH